MGSSRNATLVFSHAVRGPLLLGAGRFFGLGLMRPIGEKEKTKEE